MGTLIYSPAVVARIATADGTIYDVSADIAQFTVDRELGISNATLTLTNGNRKYDGVFTSMDRIVIYQRRFTTLLTFSGYLDQVPVYSTYAKSVSLRASCSAKRLQHFHWDPTSAAAVKLMTPTQSSDALKKITDGGVSERAVNLLNKVAGWPREQIHIGAIPNTWMEKVSAVADRLSKQAELATAVQTLGSDAMMWGNNPTTGMRQVVPGLPGQGSGTGRLPDFQGKASQFGGPSGGAYGHMALTDEQGNLSDNQRAKWGGPYYCAMRWPYVVYKMNELAVGHGVTDIGACKKWWAARKILVVSKDTGRAVVVRPADWGPGSGGNASLASADGRIIDLSETAMKALGISTDQVVSVTFADDATPCGPVNVKSGNLINSDSSLKSGLTEVATGKTAGGEPIAITSGWTRDGSDIVTIKPKGYSFDVSKLAASRFTGFVTELVDVLHYTPKVIGGFRRGSTVKGPLGNETGKADNHSYGAAIDIDWYEYGNGFYSTPNGETHPHKIPDTVRELAHKWGLWWGGDYHSIKDYMHFEVIGAPATPKEAMDKVGAGTVPLVSGTPGQAPTAAPVAPSIGDALINAFDWLGSTNFGGDLLSGVRALMNDVPIYGAFDDLMSAGLRHWCTAPNGDIIGWFPDYFGHYGTAAKMIIQDIEIEEPFTVAHSDDRLKTHMFVTSSTTGLEGLGDASSVYQQLGTAGIASVEFPELMAALFNVNASTFKDGGQSFLNRYGARPDNHAMDNITGHKQEFYFACFRFMQNWSDQWSCQVSLTYMPEVYPGMLLVFPRFGLQGYVQSVRHSGSPGQDGGGFRTEVTITAWSSVGRKSVVKGLPVGAPL